MSIVNMEMTALEKLTKARVQLNKTKPFFGFLTMRLKLIEDDSVGTMAVDKYGNLYYCTEFVDSLTEEEVKGCLAHEVMHCALEHLDRGYNKEQEVFNISADIVVNNMLINDGMQLPDGALKPRYGNFEIFGIKFKNINEKTSEEIYDKLWRKLSKQFKRARKEIEKYIKSQGKKGFDKHIYGNGKGDKDKKCSTCGGTGMHKECNGKGCSNCNNSGNCPDCNGTGKVKGNGFNDKKSVNWKKAMADAVTYARQKGNVPSGMERIVGKLFDTYIDWRGLLYRYITSQIPIDYTWARPSKRSQSLGYYLPAVEKEMLDVMVAVDTSGSISPKELSEFISEISGIVNSFKNVDLTVIDCDCRINGIHELRNASVGEVIDKIGKKLTGGGGTSHIPVFEWINKNKPNTKFVICFTDGYTDFPSPESVNYPTLWVVAGSYRNSKDAFPFGNVISLPNHID